MRMNTIKTKKTLPLLIMTLAGLTTTSLIAEDQPEETFNISAFIGIINGSGLLGDSDDPLAGSWDTGEDPLGTYSANQVSETPIEFEMPGLGTQGSMAYGRAKCTAAVTSTTISLDLLTHGIADSGTEHVPFQAWSQATGEFHIHIETPATIDYVLCTNHELSNNTTTLAIRKLENGNWNMDSLVHHYASSNTGELCSDGALEVEPGFYQLYFSSYCYLNSANTGLGWHTSKAEAAALLQITPVQAPNPADINGDGKVDGIDLGRILGAWGSTAGGGDVNGDGVTDGQDLAIVLGCWTG